MRARLPLALALLGLCGCRVSLGERPDAAPCTPSTRYFVSDLWLRYLDANQCATSGCHAAAGGHGYLRFQPPGDPPAVAAPLASWPPAWRDNYLAAIQLVKCDAPLDSRLLAVPEERADPHPPGASIDRTAEADQIFRDWIAAP